MKIAIAELLNAIDMAATKLMSQQQYKLQHTGLTLIGRTTNSRGFLALSGNTLVIEPKILKSGTANIDMKITVKQKDKLGETSGILAAQFSFLRMPTGNYTDEQNFVFSTYSAN